MKSTHLLCLLPTLILGKICADLDNERERFWLAVSLFQFSAQNPTVDLPVLGTLEGKEVQTVGNLNNPKKTIYSFRNIPFGEDTSYEKRFTVRKKYVKINTAFIKIGLILFQAPVPVERELGTPAQPYDATRTGPLCYQGGLEETKLNQFLDQQIEDVINATLIDNNWVREREGEGQGQGQGQVYFSD